MKVYAFDLEGFAARHLGGNVEALAELSLRTIRSLPLVYGFDTLDSADCDDMWQIGVDVLPEYRRNGIASALTNNLAKEILKRGKVPFYCCAWSNIRSAKNAIRSGFTPSWVEVTVKPTEVVDRLNA